jgi:hypothetical protein
MKGVTSVLAIYPEERHGVRRFETHMLGGGAGHLSRPGSPSEQTLSIHGAQCKSCIPLRHGLTPRPSTCLCYHILLGTVDMELALARRLHEPVSRA